MPKGWTRQEIANKIDWEGGLTDTLYWGLSQEHMPEGDLEIQVAFADMYRAYTEYARLARAFKELLPEPGDEDY